MLKVSSESLKLWSSLTSSRCILCIKLGLDSYLTLFTDAETLLTLFFSSNCGIQAYVWIPSMGRFCALSTNRTEQWFCRSENQQVSLFFRDSKKSILSNARIILPSRRKSQGSDKPSIHERPPRVQHWQLQDPRTTRNRLKLPGRRGRGHQAL